MSLFIELLLGIFISAGDGMRILLLKIYQVSESYVKLLLSTRRSLRRTLVMPRDGYQTEFEGFGIMEATPFRNFYGKRA
jgi:hypothetical protein